VLVKGVRHTTNAILHDWLCEQLLAVLASLPPVIPRPAYVERLRLAIWREGLQHTVTFPLQLPPLRLLLIIANLRMIDLLPETSPQPLSVCGEGHFAT
jgi:hypothetical protein